MSKFTCFFFVSQLFFVHGLDPIRRHIRRIRVHCELDQRAAIWRSIDYNVSKAFFTLTFCCKVWNNSVLNVWTNSVLASGVIISLAVRSQNLTNMTKITYLQAWIENSMPAELKKMQGDPKQICMDSKFCTLICNIDRPVKSFKVNFKG